MTARSPKSLFGDYYPTPRRIDGRPVSAFVVTCIGCGQEEAVPARRLALATADSGRLHEAYVATHLTGLGWTFKSEIRRPRCAACTAKRHPTGGAKIINIKEEPAPMPTLAATPPAPAPLALAADQGRAIGAATPATLDTTSRPMTRADRQRIHDVLDAAYDQGAQRYRGETSDASVAAELDVPRVWVASHRKEMFGDFDRNEASEQQTAALRDTLKKCDAWDAAIEIAMGEVSKLRENIKAEAKRIGVKL